MKVLKEVSIADERRAEETQAHPRRFARMDDEARGFRNQQTRYELGSEKPFPTDRAVRLVVDAGLQGAQGPLSLTNDLELAWRTYGPLQLTASRMCTGDYRCPYGPLILSTTNEVDVKSLEGKVKITPTVELDWQRARAWAPTPAHDAAMGPYVALPGKFVPGKRYKIEVDAGVRDVFGQITSQRFSGEAETNDLAPALHTGGRNALVEAGSGPKLPVEVVNLRRLDVSLWNLSQQEMAAVLAKPPYEDGPLLARPPDVSESVNLGYDRNEKRVHPIDLSRIFGNAKTGLALVRVDSPDLEWRPSGGHAVIVQVTNLAAHLKLGPAKSMVWVTDLSKGEPVPSATVSVFDHKGQVRWTGVTNAEGIADAPGAVQMGFDSRYPWESPFAMAAASVGADTGVSSSEWSDGVSPWDFNVAQGWEGQVPISSGFVFTDRGIYRPGDKVYVKGLARYRSVGALKSPSEASELTLIVRDGRGEEVKKVPVKVTSYGTFSAEVDIAKEAPTGWWNIEAQGNAPGGPLSFNGSFQVAEYRAPQFKVDVQAGQKELVAGDTLKATVFARYLFGGAMNDAKVRWSVHRSSRAFAPAGHEGFTFGQETWWWDDGAPADASGFFGSGDGLVDDKGAFTFESGAVEAPGARTYGYTVEAEVEDVNRQTVANRATVTVHPAAYYVGLRGPTGFRQASDEVPVDVLVTDIHGKRTAGRSVDVEILRRTWKSVRQKDASGGFSTISEPAEEKVHTCSLQSRGDAPVQCTFKPGQSGFYIARASVADDAKRTHTASIGVYVTGPGFVAWQRNDTERIELVPDKTRYDVGDVAKVLIKSPYPKARALLTIEREGVLERREISLEGSVKTVDVPITEAMVPNVYVGVLVIRPRVVEGGMETGDDPGRPAARVGLVKLPVERSTKRLAVDIQTAREEYRPGAEVAVELAVKDHAGRGVPSELTVYVVDESVLRLTGYQTPDPIESIYPERPLSTRLGEPLIHLVRRRAYGEKGEEQGGGGADVSGEGSGFRGNFKTTVIFKPDVGTDAQGKARVTFKLPDNLTEFRVMAVAVSKDERFGSGDRAIRVSKPLLALAALPRFARLGDEFEAGVVVHSHGAGAGDVTVTAQAENAKLLGPSERKAEVSEGNPREVRFKFTAERPGIATFRFKVQRGAESDGVEQKIPIELPVGIEAVATYGDTRDQRVEGLVPPKDARPEIGGLEVTLASTAMGNFQEGFRQLVEYPYGCLEQEASRLIPFVALRELAPKFGIPWTGPDKKQLDAERELNAFFRSYLFDPLDATNEPDPDEVIRKTVRSMVALQNEDGAFRYWSNDSCPSSHASAWATMALFRAKEVGYDVGPETLNRAQKYLTKVAGGGCNPCERSCPDETRVFASWVLARTGRPQASYYGQFHAKRKDLSLFSQALLADAMFVGGGNREQARQLLQEILNHAKESPKGVHFEEVHGQTYAALWQSDTRTTGAVLQTLATISPDHPYVSKIAHYLTGVRQAGRWRSTQEAAFSLLGLTEVVRVKEKETPDYVATVLLGSNPIAKDEFRGRSTAVKTQQVPMSDLLQKTGGEDKKLTFKKDGQGVLYYSALLRYAPKKLPMTSLESGLYVQRWFEPYEGGGQATRFYAGDLVRVRVRVATNQERHYAVVEVPLPAGLEPVDTSLATTARQTQSPEAEASEEGYEYESAEDQVDADQNPWAYSFWSPFNHVEQRDSRVVLFADHLPPGVHVSSFVARATTPGTFLLKPAKGELMYEPEVFGRSEGGTFEVLIPSEVSRR
ncbi:MAG: MG2 domain-containing protein [Myxococcaceae bacterium]